MFRPDSPTYRASSPKSFVRYQQFDLELTEPLPELNVGNSHGVALTLRHNGRVIGFLMREIQTDEVLGRQELERWITRNIGVKWFEEIVREELDDSSAADSVPSVTVAICTKDRADYLQRCLSSLHRLDELTLRGAPRFKILVVDNAPSDERTKQEVVRYPGVRYVLEARPGLNFARNAALRASDTEIVAFIDDDTVVDHFWFRGLHEAWLENPDAAAFSGQVLPLELETEAQAIFERRGGFRHGVDKVRYTRNVPDGDDGYLYPCRTGIFGVGCNMAFNRRIALSIGGFDIALDTGRPLPGGGDHDIFYRIIRAGYPLIYEPSFLVYHQHRRTMAQLRHQYWTWGLSLMAFATKAHATDPPMRRRWRQLIVRWFVSDVRELLAAVFGRHPLPARFVLWELCGGVVGLLGEYRRSCRRTDEIRDRYS